MLRNLCDTHTHTLYSGHAYSTVEENVRAAARAGLELLGIADHFSAMTADCTDFRNYQYLGNTRVWPRTWHGVRLLRGAEVDILDAKGSLFGRDIWIEDGLVGPMDDPVSLFELCTRGLDYLVASVHDRRLCALSKAEGTALYLGALENPRVLMLGHIGRAGVPFDVGAVVRAAKELHKIIEVNEHSLQLAGNPLFGDDIAGTCGLIAQKCAEEGVAVAVNTDAHVSFDVGKTPLALELLDKIGFPEELLVTRSAEAFLAAVEAGVGPVEGF